MKFLKKQNQKFGFTQHHLKKHGAGFTLMELLMVIAIIGLLASLILVSFTTSRIKAMDFRRMADLNQFQKALELYYDQNSVYPRYEAGQPLSCSGSGWVSAQALQVNCWNDLQNTLAPYMVRLPQDPIFASNANQVYWYRTLKSGQGYFLMMLPQQGSVAQTQGEACHDDFGANYYCIGRNWQ